MWSAIFDVLPLMIVLVVIMRVFDLMIYFFFLLHTRVFDLMIYFFSAAHQSFWYYDLFFSTAHQSFWSYDLFFSTAHQSFWSYDLFFSTAHQSFWSYDLFFFCCTSEFLILWSFFFSAAHQSFCSYDLFFFCCTSEFLILWSIFFFAAHRVLWWVPHIASPLWIIRWSPLVRNDGWIHQMRDIPSMPLLHPLKTQTLQLSQKNCVKLGIILCLKRTLFSLPTARQFSSHPPTSKPLPWRPLPRRQSRKRLTVTEVPVKLSSAVPASTRNTGPSSGNPPLRSPCLPGTSGMMASDLKKNLILI